MKMHKASKRLILLALGMSLAVSGRAAFDPIPLTPDSFNEDVIVENTATPKLQLVTSATVDQGTNNGAATWMEAGFDRVNPGRGLPVAGSTFVAQDNANYSFQMAPDYTAPNGILIDSVVTNGTFTLTTPASYTLLSFVTSGGNGGHQIGVRVHHQDGSTEEGIITSPDWFGGTGIAYTAGGRVDTSRNFNVQDNGENPRLYFRDVVLTNTTSPVTSVEMYFISGSGGAHSDVVAMSGATTEGGPVGPIAVTGYTYDFIIEKEAPARQRIVSTTMLDGTNVWATTQTLENQGNTSWTFYEQGYNIDNPDGNGFAPNPAAINTGLPAAGSNVTNALGDHVFTLPPSYTENNAAYLTTVNSNRTITFTTPTTASVLSFLCTAGGGAATLDVVINHQSGSSETNVIVVPDWFNTGANSVIRANGRTSADTAAFSAVLGGNMQPWINSVDLLVDESSPITSIDITHRETGGQVGIFAVSGTAEPVLPVFVAQPQAVKANVGDSVSMSANAVANVPITYQWQKGVNGVFTDVVNGGSVSGAATTNLTINPVAEIDDATYRVIASNTAGSATSAVATLIVLSPLADVTLPGDSVAVYQPQGGSFPGGEAPPNAINDTMLKYLNFGAGSSPLSIPLGFTVIPSQGRTVVSAMRLYTANDADARDPANVILEGSNDGGASYTLIYSNLITLPTGRNTDTGAFVDPINQNIAQVRFDNTNSYTSYRWSTDRVRGNTTLMQIGEVELLGVVDTTDPAPFFVIQPTDVTAYDEGFASFSVFANGTPSPTYRWQKGTNGVYVDLNDGGNISGAESSFLSISPVDFSDAADYISIANNASGSVTSVVATLTVVSTNTDVTLPGDPIVIDYEDTAAAVNFYGDNGNPIQAIDDFNTLVYINAGSSISGGAGFPPFDGPAGVVVTPSAGFTRVVGLRIYTSTDDVNRDPADYILEGSNNGGASYTVLSQGALDLPLARADNAQAFDPTVQPMQEILFANSTSYASYRLTFNNARDNDAADAIEIGEFELLGEVTGQPDPVLSITSDGAGGFNIESTGAGGSVYSTTNLSGTVIWNLEGSTPLNVAPNPAEPQKYFQIQP